MIELVIDNCKINNPCVSPTFPSAFCRFPSVWVGERLYKITHFLPAHIKLRMSDPPASSSLLSICIHARSVSPHLADFQQGSTRITGLQCGAGSSEYFAGSAEQGVHRIEWERQWHYFLTLGVFFLEHKKLTSSFWAAFPFVYNVLSIDAVSQ